MFQLNAPVDLTNTHTHHFPPLQVSLATFATYALVNINSETNRLTADKVFVALSLFNILRFPLTMLPMLISNMVQVRKLQGERRGRRGGKEGGGGGGGKGKKEGEGRE